MRHHYATVAPAKVLVVRHVKQVSSARLGMMKLGELFARVGAISSRPWFAFAVVLTIAKFCDKSGVISLPRDELAEHVVSLLDQDRWSDRRTSRSMLSKATAGPDISRVITELMVGGIIAERYYVDPAGNRFDKQGRGRIAAYRLDPEVFLAITRGEV